MRSTKQRHPSEADIFELSQHLSRLGGELALQKFRAHDFTSQHKNDKSFVTSVDIAIEDKIRAQLFKLHPTHSVIGEERGKEMKPDGHCWNIDPLDGTHNFMFGVPVFGTLINVTIDDELLVSSAFDPNNATQFTAWREKGAFVNGTPCHLDTVGAPSTLSEGMLLTEAGKTGSGRARLTTYLSKHVESYRSFRKYGCLLPAFALAASGYLGALVMFDMEYFEIATLALFLKESGYTITNEKGQSWDAQHNQVIVAAPPAIHSEVLLTLADT